MNDFFSFESHDEHLNNKNISNFEKNSVSGAQMETLFARRQTNAESKPIVTKTQTNYTLGVKQELTHVDDYSNIDFSKKLKPVETPVVEEKHVSQKNEKTDVKETPALKVEKSSEPSFFDKEIEFVINTARVGVLFG